MGREEAIPFTQLLCALHCIASLHEFVLDSRKDDCFVSREDAKKQGRKERLDVLADEENFLATARRRNVAILCIAAYIVGAFLV